MSMMMLTVIQIVQALAAYSFVMLFLSWVFLRKYLAHFELPERIIGYFLTGNFYIIYLVFLLQFLHISNSITLWIGTLFPFFVRAWRRKKFAAVKYQAESFFRFFLHILRGEIGVKTLILTNCRKLFERYGRKTGRNLRKWLPDLLLTGVVMAGVFYLYGSNTVTVFGYKASDVPVHNLWINNMSNNEIFSKGVYPYGFHCVIYYLHTAFGIKTYILMRVFCVTQTLFIHLALLVSLKVISKNRIAPYIGTEAYLFLNVFSDASHARFATTLPQEYGMMFIFPAAVMAMRFFQEYKSTPKTEKAHYRGYLLAFVISFSLTLTVHFYNTIPAGVLCVGIAFGFFLMFFRWRYFWRIMLAGIISIVVAVLPMAVGVVTGHQLEGSLYWALGVINGEKSDTDQNSGDKVTQVVDKNGNTITIVGEVDEETLQKIINGYEEETGESSEAGSDLAQNGVSQNGGENSQQGTSQPDRPSKIKRILQVLKSKCMIILGQIQLYCTNKNRNAAIAMVASILLLNLVGTALLLMKKIKYGSVLLSIGIYMLFMCIMQALVELGLPEIMQASRLCIFFCYSLGLVWGMLADVGICAVIKLFQLFFKKQWIYTVVPLVVLAASTVTAVAENWIRTPIKTGALETNEAITCLTNIIHENKDLNWTIVSANDERQMISDFGWHYEIIAFLRQQKDLKQNSVITIPTEYVYFFIEKQPVNYADTAGSGVTLRRVSKMGASQPVSTLSGIYPYSGQDRWGTMSHMYYWAQAFKKLYPQEMEVYYETTDFVCYRLHQNVNSLYNLAIDYGYNDPHETDINSDETLDSVSETSNRTSDTDLAPVLETQSDTDSKEELNGFAQELRSYYDYYGDRLFSISTSEYGEGKLE